MLIVVPEFKRPDGPMVFLAGPIQGAEDWQKKAIELLCTKDSRLNIATPRGDYSDKQFDFDLQVDWESHYLQESDGILFWLAREKEHFCDRSYAQTTRFELGEWLIKCRWQNYRYSPDDRRFLSQKIFIGIEDGFTGARYIRRRIANDYPGVKIQESLEDLCQEVVETLCGRVV